ncbi:hypothetical protein [Streptomyces sp. VN1]|uniref:hypothetical protein n=1 Tax=Streptomyces sp. VN1 TaxID=1821625 RepID=UPI001413AA69|nr:hypothetical protein [Streptomyces sp. VN1]QIP72003.1 hypothetical protein EZV63_20980 [Streptomyces sp. VN1]
MTDIAVEIELPPDWVELPLSPTADVDSWSVTEAERIAQRFAAEGEEASPEALARDLRERAEDSREREPQFALALFLSGFSASVGWLETEVWKPSEAMPELSLEQLVQALSYDHFGEPDLREVQTLAGPGVRIRQNIRGERLLRLGPRRVLQTLTYGIRPEATDRAVVMRVSWRSAALDEPMQTMADRAAETLTVTAAPGREGTE